ncbi:PrgI family protein [Candidatus Dojkabacteria bacterium]|nr:PrgI family protein [Candidatus Dojkabacteria bacterium]
MKQHAVPQEIMSVEFKLFGNFLSLREFIFIAVGLAIAYFIFFLMNQGIIPGLIAWPMIILIGGGGIIVGLVPFQDRTLDKWILNYFNAINKPTQRVWKKHGISPFQSQTQTSTPIVRKDHVVSPPAQIGLKKIEEPKMTEQEKETITNLDQEEQQKLHSIKQTINSLENKAPTGTTPANQQNNPPVQSSPSTTAAEPQTTPDGTDQNPDIELKKEQTQEQSLSDQTEQPTSQPQSESQQAQQPTTEPEIAAQNSNPETKATAQTPTQTVQPQAEKPKSQSQSRESKLTITDENVSEFASNDITGVDQKPNTINIVLKDQANQYIPQVTCIIKNRDGNPVRAAVSNQLGQIINNIPLENGTYKIELSKAGYVFPEILRILTGKVYPSIEIKSL